MILENKRRTAILTVTEQKSHLRDHEFVFPKTKYFAKVMVTGIFRLLSYRSRKRGRIN